MPRRTDTIAVLGGATPFVPLAARKVEQIPLETFQEALAAGNYMSHEVDGLVVTLQFEWATYLHTEGSPVAIKYSVIRPEPEPESDKT